MIEFVYHKQDFSDNLDLKKIEDVFKYVRRKWKNVLSDSDSFSVGGVHYKYDADIKKFLNDKEWDGPNLSDIGY